MHLNIYLTIMIFTVLIHLSQSKDNKDVQEPEIDIDNVLYLCGNKIASTLSKYCQSYYVRSKRSVSRTCCYGLGCSIRYAVETYCMEIRPKYSYLFSSKPKSLEMPIKTQISNAPNAEPSSGSHSNLIKKIRNSFPDDIQKEADARNKQVRTQQSHQLQHLFTFHSRTPSTNPEQKSLKRSFRHKHLLCRQCQCKCRRSRPRQRSTLPTITSGSHVGTDHIPHGHPVDSRAKLYLLSFQSSLN